MLQLCKGPQTIIYQGRGEGGPQFKPSRYREVEILISLHVASSQLGSHHDMTLSVAIVQGTKNHHPSLYCKGLCNVAIQTTEHHPSDYSRKFVRWITRKLYSQTTRLLSVLRVFYCWECAQCVPWVSKLLHTMSVNTCRFLCKTRFLISGLSHLPSFCF